MFRATRPSRPAPPAIRKNPKDAKLYVQRGVAWSQTGDYDYAIGDFSKAIRLDPNNALAFMIWDRAGRRRESFTKARRFQSYAELRPLDLALERRSSA